jgi:DNA-binding MarR family transcriptional regulator
MSELADGLTLSRGGLTKLVDRLEAAGYLRREAAEGDGRGLYAVLTDSGNELLRKMWPVYAGALRDTFVAGVSPDEAAAIAAGLGRANELAGG